VVLGTPAAHPTTAAQSTAAGPDWKQWVPLPGVVDLAGPRPDGALVAAAAGRLFTVTPEGKTSPFSTYATDAATQGGIAMSPGLDVAAGPTCRFEAGDVFALDATTAPLGVSQVAVDGRSARFVDLPDVDAVGGIAFDTTGRFGNKLLVAGRRGDHAAVLSVDCRGRVATLTDRAPSMEGGMAVAPQLFGDHGGDLIGVDGTSGDVSFVRFDGTSGVLVASELPAGADVGVKAVGFIPPDYLQRGGTAYLVDRGSAGPGSLWRLGEDVLKGIGVDNNDLVVSAEAGGQTMVVRCRLSCRLLPLGGAPGARVDGHITVAVGPPLVQPFRGTDPKGTLTFVVTTGVAVAGGFILFFVHRRRAPGAAGG